MRKPTRLTETGLATLSQGGFGFFACRNQLERRPDILSKLIAMLDALQKEIIQIRDKEIYSTSFVELTVTAISRCNPTAEDEQRLAHFMLFDLMDVMKNYPRREHWLRTMKQKLLDRSSELAHIPALRDFTASFHRMGDQFIHGQDDQHITSLGDVWSLFIKHRFNEIRWNGIRKNKQHFTEEGFLYETDPSDTKHINKWDIPAESTLLGEALSITVKPNNYLLSKYTGHITDASGPLNTARPPKMFKKDLDEEFSVQFERVAYQKACKVYQTKGLMNERYCFTPEAYQKPNGNNPVMMRFFPDDIEGELVLDLDDTDNSNIQNNTRELYLLTPNRLYFVLINKLSGHHNQQGRVWPLSHLVSKNIRKMKKLIDLVGLKDMKQSTQSRLLTQKEKQFIQDEFGHFRYKPILYKLLRDVRCSMKPEECDYTCPRLFFEKIYINQDVLNMVCFTNSSNSSFDSLRAATLMQRMVGELRSDDLVARRSLTPNQFTRLKQYVNHTLEVSTHMHHLFRQCFHGQKAIYYTYTNTLDGSFWLNIAKKPSGQSILIRTPDALLWVENMDPSLPEQVTLDLKANEGVFEKLDQCGLVENPYAFHLVKESNQLHAIYFLLLFPLAKRVMHCFLESDNDHLVVQTGTPKRSEYQSSGHAIYIVLRKQDDALTITIVNGGLCATRHHEEFGDSAFEPGRKLWRAVSTVNLSLTEPSTHHFLNYYLHAVLASKRQKTIVEGDEKKTKENFRDAMDNIYFRGDVFHGFGDYTIEMPSKEVQPDFKYPSQWTGNCSMHNYIHALAYALGLGSAEERSRLLIDVLKRAADLLITDINNNWPEEEVTQGAQEEETSEMLEAFEEEWEAAADIISKPSVRHLATSVREQGLFARKMSALKALDSRHCSNDWDLTELIL